MSEVATRADFTRIRYGQLWEDAAVLLEGLQIGPGDICLSVASAGDNALAMLAEGPDRVFALDLNPAQIACLELRVAAHRTLEHGQYLELLGARRSDKREDWYRRCRPALAAEARSFWDARTEVIRSGIGGSGKFEGYFALFRQRILPLIHSRRTVEALLEPRDRAGREIFYREHWDTLRWRWIFRMFFSRRVMGWLGRSAAQFRYVEGRVGDRILERARHALVELEPARNPWLHWILLGEHRETLPPAWELTTFERARERLDRLEWRCKSVEDFLAGSDGSGLSKCNLSDIFEYMSEAHHRSLMEKLLAACRPGARLAYWNMLVPRQAPDGFPVRSLETEAARLHRLDRAFFYSRFVLEEVAG